MVDFTLLLGYNNQAKTIRKEYTGNMNLGENIYACRVRNNMSQGELAAELEVSRQSVSKWENNSATPELDKLIKMSTLFDITLDELVYASNINEKKDKSFAIQTIQQTPNLRITLGLIFLVFGMVLFLLSVFWGHRLRFGEALGEIISISIVLLSISIIAVDSGVVLGLCATVYFLYSFVAFAIMHVKSITNYIFLFLCGAVILIWFITWGLRANASERTKKE